MLRAGAGDLGLLTLPVEAADLVSVPVLEEELLLVTYPTHPLAKKKQIAPADLDQQPFVLFETGSITRRLVEEFFARERIAPEIIMETENVEIIKAMVRATGSASASSRGRPRRPTSAASSCSAAGSPAHSLDRQTGWLYPKMSRLPRTVSEVMSVFETVRPRLPATTRPA